MHREEKLAKRGAGEIPEQGMLSSKCLAWDESADSCKKGQSRPVFMVYSGEKAHLRVEQEQ